MSLRNTNGWSSNSALKKPPVKLLFQPTILCPCTALSPTNLLATAEPIYPFFRPQQKFDSRIYQTMVLTQDTSHDYYIVILDVINKYTYMYVYTYIYIYIYEFTWYPSVTTRKDVQDLIWSSIQHMRSKLQISYAWVYQMIFYCKFLNKNYKHLRNLIIPIHPWKQTWNLKILLGKGETSTNHQFCPIFGFHVCFRRLKIPFKKSQQTQRRQGWRRHPVMSHQATRHWEGWVLWRTKGAPAGNSASAGKWCPVPKGMHWIRNVQGFDVSFYIIFW